MRKLLPLLAIATCAFVLLGASSPKTGGSFGTASISGTITDETTNEPIAGARVTAGRCGRAATTADDGTYTIANLAAGEYTVKAMKCGAYVAEEYPTPVHVEEGQAVTGIDIALAPIGGGGSGSISGTVYDDETNEPIAGAKVTAGGCGNHALTADDGSYTIANLADGSYTVKAMKCGYHCATYPTPVVIANGQPVTGIDFRLEPNNNVRLAD